MPKKRVTDVDEYCNFCGVEDQPHLHFSETSDGKAICTICADILNLCEICGSTRRDDEPSDEQLHFQELCFQ